LDKHVVHRPGGVADLQGAVPEGVEDLLGQMGLERLDDGRLGLGRVEEHDVDVAPRRELGAPVAPQRQHRNGGGRGASGARIQPGRVVEEARDHGVDDRGPAVLDLEAGDAVVVAGPQVGHRLLQEPLACADPVGPSPVGGEREMRAGQFVEGFGHGKPPIEARARQDSISDGAAPRTCLPLAQRVGWRTSMPEINKSYEPREVERKWYAAWLAAGAFAGRPAAGREAYSIVIPPPNVTGVLTMGHVLNNTIQDILVRRARLEGKSALWVPGTDHAGIATQTVVERELRAKGKARQDLGRERFVERVWEWRGDKGGIILEQLRRLGASCDWDRTQFTMDPAYSRAVLRVFTELFRRGRIYRGKRMVNWCPASMTALSDEEVIMKPVDGVLYKVRYEFADAPGQFIQVVTTRPETIPGDVAIAVHPGDPRYAGFAGRSVWRPLNRAAIPVIADSAVDPKFGTGALKITPAHDKADFEIGVRHKLPAIDILNADATMNELAGPELAGMERFAARRKAVELLGASGALVGDEAYQHNVGYSERKDVPIEPRLTWQWWLRYPRVDEAKAAVRDGLIRFHPERWAKVYLHWLDNIQDWCISRQLWWGHRIPVWYRKGVDRDRLAEADLADPAKVHVSVEGPPDPENWVQEDD